MVSVARELDLSFENIKDRIVFRVIGENKLQEYREKDSGNVVYRLLENDMYMIYAVEVADNVSIIFTDALLERMECSEEMILEMAKVNTEKLYPPVLKNMENVILETLVMREMAEEKAEAEDDNDNDNGVNVGREVYRELGYNMDLLDFAKSRAKSNLLESSKECLSHAEGRRMHVLTNEQAKYGAGVMFYEEVLKKVSELFGDDLFLIPSSVHEIILLPRYAQISRENLNVILNDVNDNFLNQEEVLGTNVMIYDAKNGKIVV